MQAKKIKLLYLMAGLGIFLLSTGLSLYFFTDRELKQNPELVQEVAKLGDIEVKPGLDEQKLLELIQQYRIDTGWKQFKQSDFLCGIARIRLEEVKKNYTHKGFSADRFCKAKCTISENLARGYSANDEQLVLNNWVGSASHLAILNANYTHSCLKTDGEVVVQIFGYY